MIPQTTKQDQNVHAYLTKDRIVGPHYSYDLGS